MYFHPNFTKKGVLPFFCHQKFFGAFNPDLEKKTGLKLFFDAFLANLKEKGFKTNFEISG